MRLLKTISTRCFQSHRDRRVHVPPPPPRLDKLGSEIHPTGRAIMLQALPVDVNRRPCTSERSLYKNRNLEHVHKSLTWHGHRGGQERLVPADAGHVHRSIHVRNLREWTGARTTMFTRVGHSYFEKKKVTFINPVRELFCETKESRPYIWFSGAQLTHSLY